MIWCIFLGYVAIGIIGWGIATRNENDGGDGCLGITIVLLWPVFLLYCIGALIGAALD